MKTDKQIYTVPLHVGVNIEAPEYAKVTYYKVDDADMVEDALDAIIHKQTPHVGVGWLRKKDKGDFLVYEVRIHKNRQEKQK